MNMKNTINQRALSNQTRNNKKSAARGQIQQACRFEMLEGRTMMSTTLPVAPAALTATAPTSTSVALKWTDKDSTATGYLVLRSSGSTFSQIGKLTTGTASSFTDTAVTAGQTYSYEVEAVNAAGNSVASNVAAVSTPVPLPVVPANLTATLNSNNGVALKWSESDPSVNGYVVLRSTGSTFSQVGKLTGGSVTTYTDTSVIAGQKYSYEVEAVNPAGDSVASNVVAVTTPVLMPVVPTSLTATLNSNNSVALKWSETDPTVNGFIVLRSDGSSTFTQIGKLTTAGTTTYMDTTSSPGHNYIYEVESTNVTGTSAASNTAAVAMPMIAPTMTGGTVNTTMANIVWTDNDGRATAYNILRSTNGTTFTSFASVTSGTATSYTDSTVTSGQVYYYEVQAHSATLTSAVSGIARMPTPMLSPSALTAALNGTSATLSWTNNDKNATGYLVLRATEGKAFSAVATLTNGTTKTYTDTGLTVGTTYAYEIEATTAVACSGASNFVTVTPAPAPAPSTNGVTIATRFSNELVITATGTADSVSVTESGSTLTIVADGQTTTDAAPAAGLFIYTRGGIDKVNVDKSVTTTTTVDTIDGAIDTITNADANANIWCDSTDIFTGSGVVHKVGTFAAGVSKALNAAMPNPTDGGATIVDKASLFGTGPVAGDVNQGEVGDCYFMSSLAAFAGTKPSVLTNSAVDLGDGTYAVQFMNSSNQPVFVRVSDSFSAGPFGGFMYAHPGTNGTVWAMVFEKAFCYFRTGANSFASINGGWMGEVYSDLGVNSTNFAPSASTDSALYSTLSADLSAGRTVTVACFNGPNLVDDHAYTLVGVTTSSTGVHQYIVRNPWGVSGDSLENSQGYATLTYAQFVANFGEGCIANA